VSATGWARQRWLLGLVLVVGAALLGAAVLAEPGTSERLGQRAALAAAGAALLLVRWASAPARAGATAALLVWCGLVIGGTLGSDLPRVAGGGRMNPWSHYHYILGSKYFPELGYTGLYDQTLAADRERDRPTIHVRRARDLATYARVPIVQLARTRSGRWTDARWAAFGADLAWFLPRLPWDQVLSDRGYNPTPTGNAVYRQLARLPVSLRSLQLVGLLDPALLAGAFAAVAWVFGPVRALTAAAWLLLYQGNEHRVVGLPLQYDYVVALLLMACAWRRGWPALGGTLLAYAALVRVFPGMLIAGLLVWAVGRWSAGHGVDRRVVRFGAAFGVSCALLAGAGCFSGRGPAAWVEWTDKMAVHADTHRTGEKRIGLQHVFTYQAPEQRPWPSEAQRVQAWHDQRLGWVGVAAAGTLLWLLGGLAGGRRGDDPLEHIVLGLWLVFACVVVSRYYWSAAALVFLLGPERPRDGRGRGEVAGAGLLAFVALYYLYALREGDPYARYLVSNVLLTVGWFALLSVRLRWRSTGDPGAAPRDRPAGRGLAFSWGTLPRDRPAGRRLVFSWGTLPPDRPAGR
jgi:hypothetical protein